MADKKQFSEKLENSLPQFNFKQSKFIAEAKKAEFSNPNNPKQDKIKKGGSKILKFWEIVAAATIGDYLVNPDLWTISSLSNKLFDDKTNMLNSSRCLDFPNGTYVL